MVAMCLVKALKKRPTAEKLLKHSFFKNAKPPELSVKKLFADLPSLWNRVKALQVCHFNGTIMELLTIILFSNGLPTKKLQLKDAAQLALKKIPSAKQEALSHV